MNSRGPQKKCSTQSVACERYRSQTVSVIRIEVSGSYLATIERALRSEGCLLDPYHSHAGQRDTQRCSN